MIAAVKSCLAILVAAICVAGEVRAEPAAPTRRVSLPIHQVILTDGTRRYTVDVTVGSTVLTAGLDTGSTGLRILPGVLTTADARASNRSDTYSYGSGAEYRGVIGRGRVEFGPSVSGDAAVQLIGSVGCSPGHAGCPGDRIPLSQYGVQGDGLPGEGFKAILGINMGDASVPNPLVALGVRRWIVVLPRPDQTGPGELVLNPTPQDLAGYQNFPITGRVQQRPHDAIEGCLRNDASGETVCGPTVLDSGAPGIVVARPYTATVWRDGAPVTLAFMKDGRSVVGYHLTIGRRDEGSHLRFEMRPSAPSPRLFMGIAPYFVYEVSYDQAAGTIGLKPRTAGDAAAP